MGVVSLAQLRAVGLSDDAVLRRVRLGRLRRVHRGVYGVGGAVLPREGRWFAAVMACGRQRGAQSRHRGGALGPLPIRAGAPGGAAPASRKGVPGIRLSNYALDVPDHPGLEADFYFPAYRLVIETDGWDTHRTRHAFEADRAKDAALTAAGYTVVRFTYRQLRDDPDTVADRIKAIIGARYGASPASASRNSASSESSIE